MSHNCHRTTHKLTEFVILVRIDSGKWIARIKLEPGSPAGKCDRESAPVFVQSDYLRVALNPTLAKMDADYPGNALGGTGL